MRGDIPWDADPEVDDNVVVCSFMPQASGMMSTYRPCTKGYRLHCSNGKLELYEKVRQNTFIYINRPVAQSGAEVSTSIALQKISPRVQQVRSIFVYVVILILNIHVAAGSCQ
jgi:hypothetical protein